MKKSIFKRIGLIALALFIGVGSLFMSNPLKKENAFAVQTDVTFPGDTTFLSSDIIFTSLGNSDSLTIPYNFNQFTPSNNLSFSQFFSWSFRISINVMGSINFYVKASFSPYYYLESFNEYVLISSIYPDSSTSQNGVVSVVKKSLHLYETSSYTLIGVSLHRPSDYDGEFPSLQMRSVEIGNYNDFNASSGANLDFTYTTHSNVVSYVDSTGFRFTFYLPVYVPLDGYEAEYYDYRKYYLTDVFDGTDNDYYNQGFADGKAEGLTIGENGGYQHGFDVGYDSGFIAGRVDAFESEYDYTFLGLIGAVVDAPLNAFRSLFNFELLGVNLLGFFTGVLTFALIIFVIKLLLGGK